MTPLERAIAAVNNTARVQNIAGDQQGVIGDAPLHIVVNPGDIARAVLQAIREPSEGMVEAGMDYDERELNIRLGRPPTVEECQAGEWQAMIDAALEEGPSVID